MLRIGDFSKLSRISIRMLRYYEKHNLLKPRYVDEESGYRFYAHEQIFEAAKIRFLREAGFSVAMMEEIMAQYDSPQEIQRYFQIRMKELEEERQRISNTLIAEAARYGGYVYEVYGRSKTNQGNVCRNPAQHDSHI